MQWLRDVTWCAHDTGNDALYRSISASAVSAGRSSGPMIAEKNSCEISKCGAHAEGKLTFSHFDFRPEVRRREGYSAFGHDCPHGRLLLGPGPPVAAQLNVKVQSDRGRSSAPIVAARVPERLAPRWRPPQVGVDFSLFFF